MYVREGTEQLYKDLSEATREHSNKRVLLDKVQEALSSARERGGSHELVMHLTNARGAAEHETSSAARCVLDCKIAINEFSTRA